MSHYKTKLWGKLPFFGFPMGEFDTPILELRYFDKPVKKYDSHSGLIYNIYLRKWMKVNNKL